MKFTESFMIKQKQKSLKKINLEESLSVKSLQKQSGEICSCYIERNEAKTATENCFNSEFSADKKKEAKQLIVFSQYNTCQNSFSINYKRESATEIESRQIEEVAKESIKINEEEQRAL